MRHIIDYIDHPFRGVGDLTMSSPFLDNSLTRSPTSSQAPQLLNNFRYTPQMDLYNKPDRIRISLSLPGVKMDDIVVEFEDETRVLSVSGETCSETDKDSVGLVINERQCGEFERRIRIPQGENIDPDGITAKLTNGVLEIVIPKIEGKPDPKKVSVDKE
ncbi:18.1 kDa class I heat shock protein [Yarrowia sp. B02]|nr:18.1 kDa class I heat shock protein [Yarrowia sp. B02]